MSQQHGYNTRNGTCPKSAGQERNGAETKHIIKQLTIGP